MVPESRSSDAHTRSSDRINHIEHCLGSCSARDTSRQLTLLYTVSIMAMLDSSTVTAIAGLQASFTSLTEFATAALSSSVSTSFAASSLFSRNVERPSSFGVLSIDAATSDSDCVTSPNGHIICSGGNDSLLTARSFCNGYGNLDRGVDVLGQKRAFRESSARPTTQSDIATRKSIFLHSKIHLTRILQDMMHPGVEPKFKGRHVTDSGTTSDDIVPSISQENRIVVANQLPIRSFRNNETKKWSFKLNSDSLCLELKDGFPSNAEVIHVASDCPAQSFTSANGGHNCHGSTLGCTGAITTLHKHMQSSTFTNVVQVADQSLSSAPNDEDALRCKVVALIIFDKPNGFQETLSVLPLLYADDVRSESYEVFNRCKRKVVVTTNSMMMVESFVRSFLGGDKVLGIEMEVDLESDHDFNLPLPERIFRCAYELLGIKLIIRGNYQKATSNFVAFTSNFQHSAFVGVFLKLHPFRANMLNTSSLHKMATRYFRPFEVLKRVGRVTYELQLPDGSLIHPVIHASLLKRSLRPWSSASSAFSLEDDGNQFPLTTITVLDRRMGQRGPLLVTQIFRSLYRSDTVVPPTLPILDRKLVRMDNLPVTQILIQWNHTRQEDATWEDLVTIRQQHPHFSTY